MCPIKSELHPHDARTPAGARPNGQASIGLRMLRHWSKRVFHIQPVEKYHLDAFVKLFYLEKQLFSRLVGRRRGAKLIQA
jgi:hypothetical protein